MVRGFGAEENLRKSMAKSTRGLCRGFWTRTRAGLDEDDATELEQLVCK